MILLAAVHLGFWGWALALGLDQGTTSAGGALLVAGWLLSIGIWASFAAQLARSGWLARSGPATRAALWLSPPVVMATCIALFAFPQFRTAWIGSLSLLPATALPALNSLRVLALGTVVKALRGQMPRRIGLGVGVPDTLFGLWSLIVALRGGFTSPGQELAWHVAGATILLMMVPASHTALRPPRLDAPGKGDARAILRFPLVLAPAGLALPFLILHVVAVATYMTTGVFLHDVTAR